MRAPTEADALRTVKKPTRARAAAAAEASAAVKVPAVAAAKSLAHHLCG
jgi:hypothetical protein